MMKKHQSFGNNIKNSQFSIKNTYTSDCNEKEEEPEWVDDDVSEFKNVKIQFKEIPKELQFPINNPEKGINDIRNKSANEEIEESAEKKAAINQSGINVITGDKLFQIDSDLLFNQPINNTKPNLSYSRNNGDNQCKIEKDLFKDLSHNNPNQNHNSHYKTPNFNTQSSKNNKKNICLNQPFQYQSTNIPYSNNQIKQRMIQMQNHSPSAYINHAIPNMQNRAFNANPYYPNMQMNITNLNTNVSLPNNNIANFQALNELNKGNYNDYRNYVNQQQSIQAKETEESDDSDELMNDFNSECNHYNPVVFLENPALIVKKNLFESNWFLMKDNKIIGNYNSEELLYYLVDNIFYNKDPLDDVSITDYHTDLFFKPNNLLDILKEYVPKLKRKYEMNRMRKEKEMLNYNQFSYYNSNHNNNNALMNNYNFCYNHNINNGCKTNYYA